MSCTFKASHNESSLPRWGRVKVILNIIIFQGSKHFPLLLAQVFSWLSLKTKTDP